MFFKHDKIIFRFSLIYVIIYTIIIVFYVKNDKKL